MLEAISSTRLTEAEVRREQRNLRIKNVRALKHRGYSNVAIGERLGISESSVRVLLKEEPTEDNPAIDIPVVITDPPETLPEIEPRVFSQHEYQHHISIDLPNEQEEDIK